MSAIILKLCVLLYSKSLIPMHTNFDVLGT